MPKILVFNWKMNPNTLTEAKELFDYTEAIYNRLNLENLLLICPPSLYLYSLKQVQNKNIAIELVSQDVSAWEKGAYTGDLSAKMLASLGLKYTLIGHSETRKNNQLKPETLGKKIQQALNNQLTPILCIGYQNTDQQSEVNLQELAMDLIVTLRDLEWTNSIWIAYEPLWAIGTGKTIDRHLLEQVIIFLRETIEKHFGQEKLKLTRFLYGGSLDGDNLEQFLDADLDGFLVGSASLKKEQIAKIFTLIKNKKA